MGNKLLFDYIVIGTGPAGAVIAKTLTDDKKTSVLLIEAGERSVIRLPGSSRGGLQEE